DRTGVRAAPRRSNGARPRDAASSRPSGRAGPGGDPRLQQLVPDRGRLRTGGAAADRAGPEEAADPVRARTLVIGAIVASVALVATSLALGGANYAPTPVKDPCQPRAWRSPDSLDEIAQQFTLSALDGVACELHVSRETVVLALGTPE